MENSNFSHLSADGQARMVNVGRKTHTQRQARAQATVRVGPHIAQLLREHGGVSKGNVIETARIAGIMGAKQTSDLIPMCHQVQLDRVDVNMTMQDDCIQIETVAECHSTTGVEMEALTAAAIAALTIYDMCKSADKGIIIENIRLLEKSGGKSGHWSAATNK